MPACIYILKGITARPKCWDIFLFSCDYPPPQKEKKQTQNLQRKNQSVTIQASGVTFNWSGAASMAH